MGYLMVNTEPLQVSRIIWYYVFVFVFLFVIVGISMLVQVSTILYILSFLLCICICVCVFVIVIVISAVFRLVQVPGIILHPCICLSFHGICNCVCLFVIVNTTVSMVVQVAGISWRRQDADIGGLFSLQSICIYSTANSFKIKS